MNTTRAKAQAQVRAAGVLQSAHDPRPMTQIAAVASTASGEFLSDTCSGTTQTAMTDDRHQGFSPAKSGVVSR